MHETSIFSLNINIINIMYIIYSFVLALRVFDVRLTANYYDYYDYYCIIWTTKIDKNNNNKSEWRMKEWIEKPTFDYEFKHQFNIHCLEIQMMIWFVCGAENCDYETMILAR